jgi:hypothetical protein
MLELLQICHHWIRVAEECVPMLRQSTSTSTSESTSKSTSMGAISSTSDDSYPTPFSHHCNEQEGAEVFAGTKSPTIGPIIGCEQQQGGEGNIIE